jgi:hypothetical protein
MIRRAWTDPFIEGAPVDELHGVEPAPAILAELTQVDEVRVLEVLEHPELPLEPEQVRPAHEAHGLQRQPAAALAVGHLVNDAHPTGAEAADHAVALRPRELLLELLHSPSLVWPPRLPELSRSLARPAPRLHADSR